MQNEKKSLTYVTGAIFISVQTVCQQTDYSTEYSTKTTMASGPRAHLTQI